MTIQHWLLHLAIAIALLFAQQGAALHALSHLAEKSAPQQEKHLPHSPVCDKCVAYADMGSAASSAPLAFASQQSAGVLAVAVLFPVLSSLLHAYRSRAPPRSA